MNHADIMSIFKDYYAEVLERAKAQIGTDGPLPKANVLNTLTASLAGMRMNDAGDMATAWEIRISGRFHSTTLS